MTLYAFHAPTLFLSSRASCTGPPAGRYTRQTTQQRRRFSATLLFHTLRARPPLSGLHGFNSIYGAASAMNTRTGTIGIATGVCSARPTCVAGLGKLRTVGSSITAGPAAGTHQRNEFYTLRKYGGLRASGVNRAHLQYAKPFAGQGANKSLTCRSSAPRVFLRTRPSIPDRESSGEHFAD